MSPRLGSLGLALLLFSPLLVDPPLCGAARIKAEVRAVGANKTCGDVEGAVASESRGRPRCQCSLWYQQVYCGNAKAGDRLFDAKEVFSNPACRGGLPPRCTGSQESLHHMHMGFCIDPDSGGAGPLWDIEKGEAKTEAWDRLVWNKMEKESTLVDAWSNNAFSQSWLPPHLIIGIVRDGQKYPEKPSAEWQEERKHMDSECFGVDYDDATMPDPSGCRVFAKTFRPLKALRNCIAEELEKDTIWTTRYSTRVTDPISKFEGPYTEWCAQAIWAHVKVLGFDGPPARLCSAYDSFRRAEEMMKFVLFKPMPKDRGQAIEHIERKIPFTVTWPKGQVGLEQRTVTSIRQKCFKVADDEAGGTTAEAARLQRIGVCLPIMFDKVESQGFGISDGIVKFQSGDYYGVDGQNFHQALTPKAPSLCGRLALAALPGFQHASYSFATWNTLQNDRKPGWDVCQAPKASNCRQFYFCWESALNRMCGVSEHCCPGAGAEEARKVREACRENPNGKFFNYGWLGRLGPEGGVCPRALGTGN